MDDVEVGRIRFRHALRCGVGSSLIAILGLTTSISVGCISSALFFISTIAGSSENLQGFQLRSASLTFVGALVGGLLYALVAVIAQGSQIGTFFAALLPIAFLSALRTDRRLMPMPPVANVFLGFFIITRIDDSTSQIPRTVGGFTLEATLAWLTALFVNLIFPDRAGDLARRLVASELCRLGATISKVGTNAFSRQRNTHPDLKPTENPPNHFTILMEQGLEANAEHAGISPEKNVFRTSQLPPFSNEHFPMRSKFMIKMAEASLAAIHAHRPAGRSRLHDFADLARAECLISASVYEPQILPEQTARWRNAGAWKNVVKDVRELTAKVASLEAASCVQAGEKPRFSHKLMLTFFGEAYFPLWIAHFASCAAACAKMSAIMCKATCKEMFVIADNGTESQETYDSHTGHFPAQRSTLHSTINAKSWGERRSAMYFGFLLRYRLGLRRFALQQQEPCLVLGKRYSGDIAIGGSSIALERDAPSINSCSKASRPGMHASATVHDLHIPHRTLSRKHSHHGKQSQIQKPTPIAERQALSFFAITSHAMSEEIAHIQQSMTVLAHSSDAKGLSAPLHFLVSGFPDVWERIKVIVSAKMTHWEMQFAFTHTLLLSSILALALFIPFIANLESSEVAWVYSSAALAAQLSAEPTAYIGAIRVIATITGAALGYAFSAVLDALGRNDSFQLQYAVIPFIFVVTIACLLSFPPTFRYAAFLVTLTNSVILFCPRATKGCSDLLSQHFEECFPDWRYAISRSANVSIGVVFALMFHIVFWPRFANSVAREDLGGIAINASRLFAKLHRTYFRYGIPISGDLAPAESGNNNEVSQDIEPLLDNDVFHKDETMIGEIQEKVSDPLTTAVLVFNTEANIWQHGPLKSDSMILSTLAEYVTLSVTLREMAAILGRRPIYSTSYGRSVYEHYIRPVTHLYETIQISLHNLVGIGSRTTLETKDEQILRENSFDLHMAITHIARTRGELRMDADGRSLEFKTFSAMALAHRKPARLHGPKNAVDESFALLIHDDINFGTPKKEEKATLMVRSKSYEGLKETRENADSQGLSVDDVVLYDAFTFISDGCLGSFVRIAATVLLESEKKLTKFQEEGERVRRRHKRSQRRRSE